MAKVLWVMTDVVPTGRIKPPNLSQHFFSVYRPEVLLLGGVRGESISNLTLDDVDVGITQADLVAGIDNGIGANDCRVSQTVCRHIGKVSNSRVEVAGGVAQERCEPAGGVVEAGRGVAAERLVPARGVAEAGGVAEERVAPAGGVKRAGGVVLERTDPAGGVVVAGGVAGERTIPNPAVVG